MAKYTHNTSPPVTRRVLALGAGAFSAVGLTAGAAASVAATGPAASSPIMAAASRLKGLGDLQEQLDMADRDEEALAVNEQESEVQDFITDASPKVLADAVILLMVASAEINGDNLYDDGSYGHERGDIMVRRVMHFLADMAGLDVATHGGTYFLPSPEFEAVALAGTVSEATLRFNKIDEAEAARRHAEYDAMLRHQIAWYRAYERRAAGRA